jgi:hypothetical protein
MTLRAHSAGSYETTGSLVSPAPVTDSTGVRSPPARSAAPGRSGCRCSMIPTRLARSSTTSLFDSRTNALVPVLKRSDGPAVPRPALNATLPSSSRG